MSNFSRMIPYLGLYRSYFVGLFLYLFFTLCCSFLFSAETVARTSDQQDWIQKHLSSGEKKWLAQHPVVNVPLGTNPPMYFYQDGAQGISVDFLKKVAVRTGLVFNFKNYDQLWNETLEDFKNKEGRVDLLLSVKVVEERMSFIEHTKEYLEIPMVIFTRNNSDMLTSIHELEGKRVAVEMGYWIGDVLKKEFPGIELVIVPSTEDALHEVSVNKADAYIGNILNASYIINSKGFLNLKVAAPTPYETHNQAMGVRKDWPELASIINKVFEEISIEERNEIINKYFAVRFEHGLQWKDLFPYLLMGLLFVFVILTVILLGNRKLKKEIANRKIIESKLKDSKSRYRALSEASFDGVIISDKGVILECNKTMRLMLGFESKYIVGKTITEFVSSDEKEKVKTRVNHGIESIYRTKLIRRNLTSFPVMIQAKMIHYKGQTVRVSTFRDLTESEQIAREKELHRLEILDKKRIIEEDNIRLKELDLKKNRFFSIVAHDLRGPIGTLANLIEVLLGMQKSPDPEVEKQIINSLYRSSKNTYALLENLLQWSKSEMGGMVLDMKKINLSEIVADNVAILQENYQMKNIKVQNGVDQGHFIYSDLNITHTIIRNLLANALKFTYEFGLVKVYVQNSLEGYIDLCIEDNGVGIEKNDLEKLFLLDADFSTPGTKNEIGTGLGLKLCMEFSTRINGMISAESTPGRGSVFRVRFQVAKSEKLNEANILLPI